MTEATGGTPHTYGTQHEGATLDEARHRLDSRLGQTASRCAGRPFAEVLAALERDVAEAGITPTDADLSALATRFCGDRPAGDREEPT